MTTLRVDLETFSSVDLKKCGVHKYAESDDFEILLIGYAFDNEPVRVIDLAGGDYNEAEYQAFVGALHDPAVTKTAYNAAFEITCLSKHLGLYQQRQMLNPQQWQCTSVHALYLGLPGNLADVAKVIGLAQDQQKMNGWQLIRYFCMPCKPTKANHGRTRNLPHHDPAKWALFKEYCARDVEVERAVAHRLAHFPVPEKEWRLWHLDQRMNARGIKVHRRLVENAIECDTIFKERMLAQAVRLTGLANPNSRNQLLAWLQEETDDDSITDLKKKTVPAILANTDSDVVRQVLELRQQLAKTSVSKYQAMLRAVCADDRVRGLTQFYGANRTGRWAGRIVQVQNLPQNKLRDLELARDLLIAGEYETLALLFGNVPDTLSQLIRTAFIAPGGHVFYDVDFSAIEARVIAWLAWCVWRLEVFATHGKIYEASAEQMFKLPAGSVTKKSPYRQRGKVAELALGYQGGAGALKTMGALDMGLTEEELDPIKVAWREANPEIVDLWYSVERAAKAAVRDRCEVVLPIAGGRSRLLFTYDKGFLFITLPSGRRLAYVKPLIEAEDLYRDKSDGGRYVLASAGSLTYEGLDQKTKQWGRVPTYGGKLCVAAGSLVLARRGWIPIEYITPVDEVWDGVEWVGTDGAICNGERPVIQAFGAWMTPDHQVLSAEGWIHASQGEGHQRAACRLPDGVEVPRQRWQEIAVDGGVRVRRANPDVCDGAEEAVVAGDRGVVRVQASRDDQPQEQHARHEQAPSLCGVAVDAGSLSAAIASRLAQLWRAGHSRVQALAGVVRQLLGGHGPIVPAGAYVGPAGQQQGVLPEQLPVGDVRSAGQQHAGEPSGRRQDGRAVGERVGDQAQHDVLPAGSGGSLGPFGRFARRVAQVYDLVNCGPRSRFVIWADGAPLIVHNCENITQAIARDCLAEAMLALDAEGFQQLMTVHDEDVLEVREGGRPLSDVEAIMGRSIDWAPGLLLRADGFETRFYMKEIE